MGNLQVRFLEGWAPAMAPGYSTSIPPICAFGVGYAARGSIRNCTVGIANSDSYGPGNFPLTSSYLCVTIRRITSIVNSNEPWPILVP